MYPILHVILSLSTDKEGFGFFQADIQYFLALRSYFHQFFCLLTPVNPENADIWQTFPKHAKVWKPLMFLSKHLAYISPPHASWSGLVIKDCGWWVSSAQQTEQAVTSVCCELRGGQTHTNLLISSWIPGLAILHHPPPTSPSINQQEEKVVTVWPHLFCAVFLKW